MRKTKDGYNSELTGAQATLEGSSMGRGGGGNGEKKHLSARGLCLQ